MTEDVLLSARGLGKTFQVGTHEVRALEGRVLGTWKAGRRVFG